MPHSFRHLSWGLIAILLAVLGCGGPTEESVEKKGESSDNLRAIETAYQAALDKDARPPKNREELAKHLPPGTDVEQLFISPRDGKPLVIAWGTDVRAVMMASARPVVYGYEAEGVDGDRFVLTTVGVMELTDEDFAAASFPEGHSPPQVPQ